jgi:hypothetical protein
MNPIFIPTPNNQGGTDTLHLETIATTAMIAESDNEIASLGVIHLIINGEAKNPIPLRSLAIPLS